MTKAWTPNAKAQSRYMPTLFLGTQQVKLLPQARKRTQLHWTSVVIVSMMLIVRSTKDQMERMGVTRYQGAKAENVISRSRTRTAA
mmetsp:Transcript_41678/g.87481  ORF Transcript_41678/g.87481 Transcript_41678/m.87481 type:complete len:86 (+) Transcript_41678:1640-1897(+)